MEKPDQPLSRSIQEFVPGKQVTLAHLIAHPTDDLAKKIGVPGAEAIGIMTLTPGETAMMEAAMTKVIQVEKGMRCPKNEMVSNFTSPRAALPAIPGVRSQSCRTYIIHCRSTKNNIMKNNTFLAPRFPATAVGAR